VYKLIVIAVTSAEERLIVVKKVQSQLVKIPKVLSAILLP
jgi:hypothetical protein